MFLAANVLTPIKTPYNGHGHTRDPFFKPWFVVQNREKEAAEWVQCLQQRDLRRKLSRNQERIAEMMDNGSDVDDQWCDDEYSSEASEFDREGNIRHNQLHTIGYHEGLSKGQEAAAQEGFTNGFKESVSVGYKWGLVRGVSSALACLPDGLKEKLVESPEAREKFQMLYTSISSVSKEDALGLYRDEVLHDQSKEHSKAAEVNSSSETLSSDHISRCSRLRGYSEELEFLLQSSAIQVHSTVE